MARKTTAATSSPDPRSAAIEALMRLASERDWEEIELADIAASAGLTLKDLRGLFPSKAAMLGGFARMMDDIVLADMTDDLSDEPIRERLFDVMMRRLDAMAPYKPALRRIMTMLRRHPLDLAALNGAALNSWRYMLASVDVPTEDELGAVRLQGAVLVYARVMETWFSDDDPGLARTMARLDRELERAGRIMRGVQGLHRLTAPFRGALHALCSAPATRRRERSPRPGDAATEAA